MKWFAGTCSLMAVLVAVVCPADGGRADKAAESVRLSQPELDKGLPVMKALKNRRSDRSFSEKKLSHAQMSELVWAANGVNREDGKRTAPAAINIQAVDIYVVTAEGVYLYDAGKHELNRVIAGDHRKFAGSQGFVREAPVNLVYVADMARFGQSAAKASDEQKMAWVAIETGCQAQNAALYCASEGLGSIVRTSIDAGAFGGLVGLRPEQVVILSQTVGHPKTGD